MAVYQYDYIDQATSVTADVKDVFHHAFVQSCVEMADGLEMPEVDDGEGLLILVDWIGLQEEQRMMGGNRKYTA